MAFNILVQGFCPLKLKLLNFLTDSLLILFVYNMIKGCCK